MTVSAFDGPIVTKGWEPPIGSATAQAPGVTGSGGAYVSGQTENPDAGPDCIFDGVMLKDAYYRYLEGGGANTTGGYPNQALGFVEHQMFTASFVPSTISAVNISTLHALTANVAQTLVSASGAGITVTTAAFTVLNTGNIVPAGVLLIDAVPSWQSFGTSGAMQGWAGAAVGRALSLTSTSDLSAIHFTFRGYDLYGNAITETRLGPNNTTVNTAKCFKWLTSVTPDATSASTVSIGTADIFEAPIRADRFSQMTIYWDETLIVANTGFVAAVTTTASATTGDTRGTYATQTASDGTRRLVFFQRMTPAQLATSPPKTGMFGVVQA